MDFLSMLAGILLGIIVTIIAWAALGWYMDRQGPTALATIVLVLLAGGALADDHNAPEPYDGPECADLMGRYVECPGAKPSPSPAPPPPVTRVQEPPVRPEPPESVATDAKDDPKREEVKQKPATLTFAAGALALLGGGVAQDVTMEPGVSLGFDGPLFKSEKGKATRLELDARFGGDQAPSLELTENTVFQSVALAGRLCQPIHEDLFFMPCVEAGFATRLEGDTSPRYTSPRWLSFQVKAVNAQGDYISLGVGPDERLDDGEERGGPYYRPAVQVAGSVKLWGPETTTKVHLRLVMQAVLFLRTGAAGRENQPADRVTLGILVAR